MKIKLDEYGFVISATTNDNTFGENDIIVDGDLNNTMFYCYGIPVNKYVNGQMVQMTNELDYVGTHWIDIYYEELDKFYLENNRLPYYGASLDLVKTYKIKELSVCCSNDITNGFHSKAFDGVTEKIYDFAMEEKTSLTSIVAFISSGIITSTVNWKAKGEISTYPWTILQILTLCGDAMMVFEAKKNKYFILKQEVLDCTTRAEVEAINYIP